MKQMHGLDVDPLTDIAICCGQSEAFAATMFAIINPGDEVILFDPSYETYETCIKMAGGVPVYVSLDPPHWNLGRRLYKKLLVIGWAIAPACFASAIRNIHIKVTDSAPAPFQEAALVALTSPLEYFESLRKDYESKRNYIVELLLRVGFQLHMKPKGSFFVFAELPASCVLSDIEFVEELIKQAGVVAVPGCGFFHTNQSSDKFSQAAFSYQKKYIRFAFCKSDATLYSVQKN
ncbi:hypothetical protein RJ639_014244 [Escallonia herrerae]|uniref:Aminotransferase class I/classII large domain-containing protein n=1 Tax=Escallonia herrerae TaxID=1293975 RepID=A0AA89AMM5_9ASTE|nr:hypothetical protein RJ639_014244 [Escallonia herrerae]